jgi:DNA repair ATPase RecN
METQAQAQTLKELRTSLQEIDAMRRVKDISDAEREALELTAVALRDAERVAIAIAQKQFIKDMETQTASLTTQARAIRARVTQINKMPKVLDKIESVIKTAVKIVAAIAKW